MLRNKKQYNTRAMVDNKQNVKVKEEEDENMSTKEKREKNKYEGDKKTEEKQNSSKRKMAKYKEEKEKKMRVVDKKDDEKKEREERRKRKGNEKNVESHKERKEDNENEKEEEQKKINDQKGRKEIDKEEEESKKRDEKDQNDERNCPQFFRALTSPFFMEHMTIPVGFHKYLEECTGMVSLTGPSRNKWPVELAKISGELCFARGWKEFVSDHRIGYGWLLVFRYDRQSQFSVTVFLPSSCEAPYASLTQPQRKDIDVAGEEAKGLMSTNADGTAPQEEGAHTGTSADGTPQSEASEEEDVSEEEEAEEEDALSKTLENGEDSECHMCSDDALEPVQQQQADRRKTDDGFVVGKRARFRKVDDIMAEVDRSNKSKPTEGKNSEAPSGDPASEGAASSDSLAESEHRPPKKSKAEEIRSPSGDSASKSAASSDNLAELASHPFKESKAEGKSSAAPFIFYTRSAASASKRASGAASSDNLAVHTGVFAPESIRKDLTTLHKSFGKKYSMEAQFPMFNKSNSETQPGRVLIKVMRRPGLTSQRRPVTQREKEDAMERVGRLKSERPFTVKAMKHNDVYASYFMIIPDKFVKTFLPKESRKMTLWDPQAKPWKVWYEYTGGKCPRAAFSAGWGALAMENNLEKWDVCVFELLDQEYNYNIKLHVHKVVLKITPCVLAPKPRAQE